MVSEELHLNGSDWWEASERSDSRSLTSLRHCFWCQHNTAKHPSPKISSENALT